MFARALALAAAAVIAGSCGRSPSPPVVPGTASELEAAIEELRFRIASDPKDAPAHVALARLELRAGRPGAAVRHYEAGRRALRSGDRVRLAELYLARARARADAGDGDAYRDLERARELAGDPALGGAELTDHVYLQGALAALRHSAAEVRARAPELLERVGAGDPRRAILDPAEAPLDDLGAAAVWLAEGGARRAARELLLAYFERGGREHGTLLLELERWWGGRHGLPDLLIIRELVDRGADPCVAARTPDDLGCAAHLESAIARGGGAGEAGRRRAAQLFWRTDEPALAAAFTALALRSFVDGTSDGWTAEVARRVDLDVAADPRVPAWAAATLLRAAGDGDAARVALVRAVADAASLLPLERAVVVAEAAAVGDLASVEEVLAAGDVADAGWAAALRGARAARDRSREKALLARAPQSVARAHLEDAGAAAAALWGFAPVGTDRVRLEHAVARWWRATDDAGLGDARDALVARWQELVAAPRGWSPPAVPAARLGFPDAVAIAARARLEPEVARALADVAAHYAREPAVADRLAGRLADGAVYVGERGPAIAALFDALGDPLRALLWWERVAEASPGHYRVQLALARAVYAVGDPDRAEIHVVAGAAASGDPGAELAHMARVALRYGDALSAIGLAKRALPLTPSGEQREVLEILVEATLAVGRADDAAGTAAYLIGAIPAPYRAEARAYVASRWPSLVSDGAPSSAAPQPDKAAADSRTLGRAVAWNPRSVAARAAHLAALSPGSDEHAEALAALLAVAVSAPPAIADDALAVAADGLEAIGASDAAARARRERRTLTRAGGAAGARPRRTPVR